MESAIAVRLGTAGVAAGTAGRMVTGGPGPAELARCLRSAAEPLGPTWALRLEVGHLLAGTLRGEGRPLARVASLRIAPQRLGVAPRAGWDASLRARVDGGTFHLTGGADFAGARSLVLDGAELRRLADRFTAREADALAIAAVGTLSDPSLEDDAVGHLAALGAPEAVLSQSIGGLRFYEREASAILGAALQPLVRRSIEEVRTVLDRLPHPPRNASVFLADGSCLNGDLVIRNPLAALGTEKTAIAQGACRRLNKPDAAIVVCRRDRSYLFITRDGRLRSSPLRTFPRYLPGVQLAQRHATRTTVEYAHLSHVLTELRGRRALIIVPPAGESPGWTATRDDVLRAHPDCLLVDEEPDHLALAGIAGASPLGEVFAVTTALGREALERARVAQLGQAQNRVLATDPLARLSTHVQQATPMSFLGIGPVLIRSLVGTEEAR